MPSTTSLDDGAVFVISVDPTADWDHSTFPEPLITVDHDAEGNVIKIVAVGKAARELAHATTATLTELISDASTAEAVTEALA
ncbi:MAG: hypothetical protein M3065_05665 [Actinomycetota bacterium]|nr:hypothetical protein [Actinomycetota bacterium]